MYRGARGFAAFAGNHELQIHLSGLDEPTRGMLEDRAQAVENCGELCTGMALSRR